MLKEKSNGNINFIRIVNVLKQLMSNGLITKGEFARATEYYRKMTGADIAIY